MENLYSNSASDLSDFGQVIFLSQPRFSILYNIWRKLSPKFKAVEPCFKIK